MGNRPNSKKKKYKGACLLTGIERPVLRQTPRIEVQRSTLKTSMLVGRKEFLDPTVVGGKRV
jgi:hypothetical protein